MVIGSKGKANQMVAGVGFSDSPRRTAGRINIGNILILPTATIL